MRFFIIDNRHFLPSDCRLIKVLGVLHETAILGRAASWTHLGIAIVGYNMYTDVLHLQDMEPLSLFAFNKAFDDLGKIIRNNNASFGVNLAEKKQKLLSNISFALQSIMKQFKDVKGKNEKELLITIIAARWKGSVEQEVEEFFHSSRDVVSISQVHIIEIADKDPLKNVSVTDGIQIHSLPTQWLYMGVQAVFKTEMLHVGLKLHFPGGNIIVKVKVEELFIDFSLSRRDIPCNLTIVSYIYPTDLCQVRVDGRCFLLSCTDTDSLNFYRWQALSQLMQNNETILMAKEQNTFSNYILIPCDNLRILMQSVAPTDLLLPGTGTLSSDLMTKDFDANAKLCGLAERYNFGPKSDIIRHLKMEWSKIAHNPNVIPNPKQGKQVPLKKRISMKQTQLKKMSPIAHPALAMYSNK